MFDKKACRGFYTGKEQMSSDHCESTPTPPSSLWNISEVVPFFGMIGIMDKVYHSRLCVSTHLQDGIAWNVPEKQGMFLLSCR